MGLSLVSKLAPARTRAVWMGLFFVSTSVGGYLAGEVVPGTSKDSCRTTTFFRDRYLLARSAAMVLMICAYPLIASALRPALRPESNAVRVDHGDGGLRPPDQVESDRCLMHRHSTSSPIAEQHQPRLLRHRPERFRPRRRPLVGRQAHASRRPARRRRDRRSRQRRSELHDPADARHGPVARPVQGPAISAGRRRCIGPVHPKFVDLSVRGGLGWLTGFDEWLCRCGLAWNGPPGDDDGLPAHAARPDRQSARPPARSATRSGRREHFRHRRGRRRRALLPASALANDVHDRRSVRIVVAITTWSKTVRAGRRDAAALSPELRPAVSRRRQPGARARLRLWPNTHARGRGRWRIGIATARRRRDSPSRSTLIEPRADADGRTLAVLHDAAASERRRASAGRSRPCRTSRCGRTRPHSRTATSPAWNPRPASRGFAPRAGCGPGYGWPLANAWRRHGRLKRSIPRNRCAASGAEVEQIQAAAKPVDSPRAVALRWGRRLLGVGLGLILTGTYSSSWLSSKYR